jgi:hypothetical protein
MGTGGSGAVAIVPILMPHTIEQHRQEVVDTYIAADRARLYALLTAAYGLVAVLAALGAIIIGWIDVWDGVVVVAGALLSSVVPAAKFYADAVRTTLAAAALERHLGSETDDLFDATPQRRRRVRLVGIAGLALAAVLTVGIAGYSVQNADTRTQGDVDDDDDDEREDDDGRDEGGDDDGSGNDPGESPDSGGDDAPEGDEGKEGSGGD